MSVYTKIWVFIIFLLLGVLFSCSSNKNRQLEEPKYYAEETYIKYFAYSLVYNDQMEQANWVAYNLESKELHKNYKRKNNFRVDTMVHSQTANNADYYKSGFDRGHLAAAADMTWNEQAMSESFYYSNMSPQRPGFNRGIWKRLESKVRRIAVKYENVYVCVGPIFKDSIATIGANEVAVPSHYYKALLIYNDTLQQSIAFVMPNKKSSDPISSFAISVDSLEQMLGVDLFHSLPNKQEISIENNFDINYWLE